MANNTPTSGSANTPSPLPRGLIGRGGAVIGPGARLPSLLTPRDLTRGGVVKRKYTPTFNTARKEKPKDAPVAADPRPAKNNVHRGRGRGRGLDRGRGRGRGRGGAEAELIQMPGLLFCGENRQTQRRRYEERPPSVASYIKRPNCGELKREAKVDVENDEVLKQIYRDDFIEYDDDDDELNYMPSILPLRLSKPLIKSEGSQKFIKKEVKVEVDVAKQFDNTDNFEIKKEPTDSFTQVRVKDEPISDGEEEKNQELKLDKAATVISRDDDFMSCAELLCSLKESNQEELLLFHLPDSLPVMAKLKEDEKPGVHQQSNSEAESHAGVSLANLSEGCMGKLQVLKSGKMRLVLGNITLNVEMGTPVGFLQDLMSMHVNQDRGELSTLDHVHHRLVCTPDLDQLC